MEIFKNGNVDSLCNTIIYFSTDVFSICGVNVVLDLMFYQVFYDTVTTLLNSTNIDLFKDKLLHG